MKNIAVLLFLFCVPFLPFSVAAAYNQEECVSEWMKKGGSIYDKASYRSFGTEFCSCLLNSSQAMAEAGKKPRKSDINNLTRSCVSASLLHEAMRTFKKDRTITAEMAQKACNAQINSLRQEGEQETNELDKFCACSSENLAQAHNDNKLTDKQYAKKIDGIAKTCEGSLPPMD